MRVDSETPPRPLSTRLTVASLTPAFRATSVSRFVTPQCYVTTLQKLSSAVTQKVIHLT